MQSGKDSITLNQVRAIMDMLAQKHDCAITTIEISQVQSKIGKGSNGTIGAFVKQVKQEHINAKAYDRSNISTQLKSALREEIDKFADNARENATEELETVENLNDELRDKIDRADETIRDMEEVLKIRRAEADKEAHRLNDELVKATEKIDSHKGIIDRQKDDLDSCRSDLAEKATVVVTLSRQIGTLEAELKSARTEASVSSKELAQAIISRDEAERKAALAEQATAHQQKTIDLVTGQACKLENQLTELKTQVSELATKNGQLHQNLDEVNRDRINDLKTAGTQVAPSKATAEARKEEKPAKPAAKGEKAN